MNVQTTSDNEEIDYESVVNSVAPIDERIYRKETYERGKETIQNLIGETQDLLQELLRIQRHISKYKEREDRFFQNGGLRALLEKLTKSQATITEARYDVKHYVWIRKTLKSQTSSQWVNWEEKASQKREVQQFEEGTFNQMVQEVWKNVVSMIQSLIELDIIVDFWIKTDILMSCGEHNHSFTTLVSHVQALHKSSSVLTKHILEKWFSQYINPDIFDINESRAIPEEIDSPEYFQYQLGNLMKLLDGIKYNLWCFQEWMKMELLDQNELMKILSFVFELNEQLVPMKSSITYITGEIDGKCVHIPQLILRRMITERMQRKQQELE